MRAVTFRLAILVALLALPLGCKQGVGERCQITSDCEDGLECGQTIEGRVCIEKGTSGVIDAPPPALADAGLDGGAADAAEAVDADETPDAEAPDAETPDAAGTVDAEEADAAP